jgi:tRNA dimethylallyltransferase
MSINDLPKGEVLPAVPKEFQPLLDAWYLTGPTASGKSAVGVALARRLKAEIVSMDSMAIFRGMDIGTAKPTLAERQQVPHHLVDLLEPTEDFSIAQYLQAAHQVATEIRSRGRVVLFAGGTPLYLKALLRGLFIGPAADWVLRKKLSEEAEGKPPDYLHRRLAEVDPVAASKLHPHDTRRIIRALEVYLKTGQPISSLQRQFEQWRAAEDCRVFVLWRSRDDLRRRISERVAAMFEAGLVEEVKALLARYGRLSRTASQALGYREVLEYLEGRRTLAETQLAVQRHTWQFARRQMMWFRSLSECRFVPVGPEDSPEQTVEQILRMASQTPSGASGPARG